MSNLQTTTTTSIAEESAQIEEMASFALDEANKHGASGSEVDIGIANGFVVNVRKGSTDTIQHVHEKEFEINVFFGHQTGNASTTSFQYDAIRETVESACRIAKYTDMDKAKGLPDVELLQRNPQDLDLYHPWNLRVDEAIDIALESEQSARDTDPRITNSEGAMVSSFVDLNILANSDGFNASTASTEHEIYCSVIASDDNGMQAGSWYTNSRNALNLDGSDDIGKIAAERACLNLSGKQIKTMKTPVIFEAPIASSLLRHLVSAIHGHAQYHKASFLLDAVGQQIFPDFVRIHEQPLLRSAIGRSRSYDAEGVATQTRDLVTGGILQGYVLNSYVARKLGMTTTGNCGGVRNLTLDSTGQNLSELLKDMGTGLLVTRLMGSSVNTVTGDYSRGASGFWIESGEVQFPVEEITVAGNLLDMFKSVVAVGNDVDTRCGTLTGSIMLDEIAVAGS